MAKIGIKGLTYAPFTSGGEGGAITYGSGATHANLMIRADVTLNKEDVKLYADNTLAERDNGTTSTSISLELAELSDSLRGALLGNTYDSSAGTVIVTNKPAPYVGFGYITDKVVGGSHQYTGYWHYKVQFGLDTDGSQTKGESTQFNTYNLTGEGFGVVTTTGGDTQYYITKTANTESAVRTWLNGQASITG